MKHKYLYYGRILITFGCILALTACSASKDIDETPFKTHVPVSKPIKIEPTSGVNPASLTTETDQKVNGSVAVGKKRIPKEFNLDMLFYPQSPYEDWGLPYQETCEEASLLLAYYFLSEKTPTIEPYHQDLLALVEWQKDYFGQYFHTSVAETGDMGAKYFGLKNYRVVDNPSIEEIKEFVAQGFPVLVPTSGRALGNPFFSGKGDFYHMLVVRGYDETHFITNDVGTKRGENFIYKYDVLMNAMHDLHPDVFTDNSAIVKGKKRILVIMPN
jgi:hypothetical protein